MIGDFQEEKVEQAPWIQLVTFFVGREEYALDILYAQEVLRIPEVTRVPKTPAFITGVINLRGKIIPIVDLRKRFGVDSGPTSSEDSRVVVVNYSSKIVGLVVDTMSEVLRIQKSFIYPAPMISKSQSPVEVIHGMIRLNDRILIYLDLESLLSE